MLCCSSSQKPGPGEQEKRALLNPCVTHVFVSSQADILFGWKPRSRNLEGLQQWTIGHAASF